MKKNIYILITFVLMSPMMVFAKTNKTLKGLIEDIVYYLDQALLLLMGFAVLAFVWYIFKYFITPNDKRTEAGQYLMWSLIGFFVILSMWGLVNILLSTFDLGSNNPGSWGEIKNLFPN